MSRPGGGWGCPGPGPGGCVSQHAHTDQQTATAADGTHPTGMYSCTEMFLSVVL